MDGIIQEGKTVREAIKRGLAALGIPEEDADIVVLDEGSSGILNVFGRRRARVKIVPGFSPERVRRNIEQLLGLMGFGGHVEVSAGENRVQVSIETAGLDGLLIGRHGQTLDALRHVIDRMVNRGRKERRRVTVDVGGYRRRRSSPREEGTRGSGRVGRRARRRAPERSEERFAQVASGEGSPPDRGRG